MLKTEIETLLGQLVASMRYRWHALFLAVLVCLLGWAAVYLLSDQYESRAQIYVDTKTVLRPLLQGIAVSSDTRNAADVVRRALLSRQTLEMVATKTKLMDRAKTPEEADRLLVHLGDDIKVTGSQESGIYAISFVDRDPLTAQRTVQILLDTFVAGSSYSDRSDTARAEVFLEEQVKEYADRLSASELRLAAFKKEHIGSMPGQNGDYFLRLQASQAALDKKKDELSVALRKRNELRAKIGGDDRADAATEAISVPNAKQIQAATELDARLQESHRQLDELLLKYTDRHPAVIALQETIQQLETRRRSELGGVRPTTSTSRNTNGDSVDTVLQELQIRLDSQDLQVAALQVEVAQEQERLANIRRQLENGPEIEATLSSLNRDYGVTKAQYEQLQQRLETARISGRAERDPDVKFRVLDPPRLPIRPVAPKRRIFLGVVFFTAISMGVVLALVLSQAKPVFMTRQSVEQLLSLPIAGTATRIQGGAASNGRSTGNAGFAAATVMLFIAFVAVVAFSQPGSAMLRAAIKEQTS